MESKLVLNHVAILVEDIEAVLSKNTFQAEFIGAIEEFPSEGTRELYIGKETDMGKLLLMQPNGDGPYKSAFDKRGVGLHHIALDVLNIDEFVESLAGSGWMLHPKSLGFYKSIRQVWLSRPGVPVLIEINEVKELLDKDYFIESLEFPFREERLLNSLCCDRLKIGNEDVLVIENRGISVRELIG